MYHIINGGYFTKHPQSFLMERPMGFDHFVFLRIRSEAVLCISNHTYNVPPNSYLFIRPHTPYSYHNPNGSYMDDWIHFDCSAQEIDTLPSHIFHQPFPAITRLLSALIWNSFYGKRTLHRKPIARIMFINYFKLFFAMYYRITMLKTPIIPIGSSCKSSVSRCRQPHISTIRPVPWLPPLASVFLITNISINSFLATPFALI